MVNNIIFMEPTGAEGRHTLDLTSLFPEILPGSKDFGHRKNASTKDVVDILQTSYLVMLWDRLSFLQRVCRGSLAIVSCLFEQ
jgi:hypothetical protein